MPGDDDENAPVKAKAFLIDPVSMTVVWANESAAGDLAEGGGAVAIERAVPVAGMSGRSSTPRPAATSTHTAGS